VASMLYARRRFGAALWGGSAGAGVESAFSPNRAGAGAGSGVEGRLTSPRMWFAWLKSMKVSICSS
jgi:hypothetical protein